jgi:hypothetical protein
MVSEIWVRRPFEEIPRLFFLPFRREVSRQPNASAVPIAPRSSLSISRRMRTTWRSCSTSEQKGVFQKADALAMDLPEIENAIKGCATNIISVDDN